MIPDYQYSINCTKTGELTQFSVWGCTLGNQGEITQCSSLINSMTSMSTIKQLTAPVNTASITISLPHTELGHTNLNRSQSRNFSSSEISVPLSSASSSSSYLAVCLYPEGSNPIERTERETTHNELPDKLHISTQKQSSGYSVFMKND